MKAVLISIQPKWCDLIARGAKTVEARKTTPKLKPPFKCYIYETQGRTETPWIDEDGHEIFKGRGQVIGEFVCDKLIWVVAHPSIFAEHPLFYSQAIKDACLTQDEVEKYSNGADVYGWHISDLVIYDKPKELWELKIKCKEYGTDNPLCDGCNYYISGMCYEYDESDCGCNEKKPITRPPQSWCYVDEQ